MAKYLVLIYGDEKRWDEMSQEELQHLGEGHRAFMAAAGDRVIFGGELESTTMASSLRSSSAGRPVVTDGPFTETKEVVGGFYLLEASDLDEAISLAGLLPEISVDHSGVEVRPLTGKA